MLFRSEAEDIIEKLRSRFPFGSWVWVGREPAGGVYTGRKLQIVKTDSHEEIQVSMCDFINGRMDKIDLYQRADRPDDDPASALEKAEYRSAVGNLHWLASQYRPDLSFMVNAPQKKQNAPSFGDLKQANKLVGEAKSTAQLPLRIMPIKEPMVVLGWTDSALYGSLAEQPHLSLTIEIGRAHV